MSTFRRAVSVLAIVAMSAWAAKAAEKKYDPGASDTEIKIGQTNAYSGPMSMFATLGNTEKAYFDMINAKGGINGRKVNFMTSDDAMNPPKTVEVTRRMVESDEVFLMFSAMGTASNTAVQKYLNGKKVPQAFFLSGAGKFDNPKENPWSISGFPTYPLEARIYAKYMLKAKPEGKVAILYQNDDAGKDMVNAFKAGLGSKASQVVQTASYELSDPTVSSQIQLLKSSGADVFGIFASAKGAAQALRYMHESDWKPTVFLFSVSQSIESVLKVAGPLETWKGVLTATAFKTPMDAKWVDDDEHKRYAAFMKEWNPHANIADFNNLYGYAVAQMLTDALKRCGDDLTRENFMKQASSFKDFRVEMTLPGILLNNSSDKYTLYHQLQMTEFDGISWQVMGELLNDSD